MVSIAKRLAAKQGRTARIARVAACIVCVLLGYFLEEFAFNPEFLFTVQPGFAVLNVLALAWLFAVVYFLGQQTRAAMGVFLALAAVVGLANHYVLEYKGQPILPSDLFALGTAAEVSGGYTYAPDYTVVLTVVVLLIALVALVLCVPKVRLSKKLVCVNLVLALAAGGSFVGTMAFVDLEEATGVNVNIWSAHGSFCTQGTLLCFLQRCQELTPEQPDGYSDSEAESLMQQAQDESTYKATASGEDAPVVIAVMNETFADLSLWDELEGQDAAKPSYFYQLAKESTLSGYAYVSAYGGGTCNSEFEFLTGASCGNMGGGVYPYMLYNLAGTENLASYFASQGYQTHAIHPANAENWRRNQVYSQFGFQSFDSDTSFEGAETLREKVTDKETYKKVLELIEEGGSTPQFVFDVTLQNHSGYETGLIPQDKQVHAQVSGADSSLQAQLDEYLSCIQQSDQDLEWFVGQLKKLKRKVVLCFFGDHGPSLIGDMFATESGLSGATELNQVQKGYTVPYLIWSNYETSAPDMVTTATAKATLAGTQQGLGGATALTGSATQANMSLNYLGTATVQVAGLQESPYQAFLAKTYQNLPCLNLNGVMNKEGVWHWVIELDYHPDWSDALALHDLRIVQYANLFGSRSSSSLFIRPQ